MQGVGLEGVLGEDGPVERFGVGQTAGLMELHGLLQS
jgi:hypothetical protein